MKKIIYVFIATVFCIVAVSCEEELVTYSGESYAQLNGESGSLTINPSENTVNVYTVGVTEASSSDRSFTISIDTTSTVDPSYYEIESLTGTIPAGAFVGEISITTFATLDFPESGAQLIINLESVEGTEIINSGVTTKTLSVLVACAFDVDATVGTYQSTQDDFFAAPGVTFEVIAGPEANQITIIDPFGFDNEDYKLIVDIDPQTGTATVDDQNVWDGTIYGYTGGNVTGDGFVFSCLESMQFDFEFTVDQGSFGAGNIFSAEKQ